MSGKKRTNSLNVILVPQGQYDTAGNKRLNNLAKQMKLLPDIKVTTIQLPGDKDQKPGQNRLLYLMAQAFFLCINLLYAPYLLIKNYDRHSDNILYFYEGKHVTLFRVFLAKLLGYFIIVDIVEDTLSILKVSSISMKIRMTYFLFMQKILPSYAGCIVVVSKMLQHKMENNYNNKVPVYLLPVTFDPDDFKPDETHHFNAPTVLYGGNFGPNYDFASFFKACDNLISEFPTLQLCLTGKVTEEVKSMVNRYIKHDKAVSYAGYLNDKEYFSCVRGADILGMPRNNTLHANAGFPFKLAEYLAAGKPVITSKASDVTDYLSEDDAFMYDSGDQTMIENHIRTILTDPAEAERRSCNGRLKADKYFNSLTVTTDFLNYLNHLLNRLPE